MPKKRRPKPDRRAAPPKRRKRPTDDDLVAQIAAVTLAIAEVEVLIGDAQSAADRLRERRRELAELREMKIDAIFARAAHKGPIVAAVRKELVAMKAPATSGASRIATEALGALMRLTVRPREVGVS